MNPGLISIWVVNGIFISFRTFHPSRMIVHNYFCSEETCHALTYRWQVWTPIGSLIVKIMPSCGYVARHRKQDLLFTLWLSTGDGWHQVHPNVYSYSAAISACEKGEQLQLAAWRFIKATPCREVTGMVRKGDYSKIAESRLVNCHIWLVVWNMIFLTFHIIIGNNDRNWLSYLSEG